MTELDAMQATMGRLKLNRDIVFFDLEATGTDPARDRIVQVAMVRLTPGGGRTTFESLVDPEVPIPPEASEIHHISNEMVRGKPRLRDIAPKILDFIHGADLGGFGVIRYDVPMLQSEFKRSGFNLDVAGHRIVDALTIYHKMESRNLTAALQFYCGRLMEHAHNASADTVASLDVFLAQVERYRGEDGRASLPEDIEGIAEFCAAVDPKNVDSRGKFVWRHGEATFNFGKHQTRSLREVVRIDRSYVEWLSGGDVTTPEVAYICKQALVGEYPRKGANGSS